MQVFGLRGPDNPGDCYVGDNGFHRNSDNHIHGNGNNGTCGNDNRDKTANTQ